MTELVNHAVLTAHRARVAAAMNFQEFQEAQLDLLDFMIATLDREETEQRALANYSAKYDDWADK